MVRKQRKRSSTKRSYGRKRSGSSSSRSSSSRGTTTRRRSYYSRRANQAQTVVKFPKYFKAQMNPFDMGGYGARIPDTNTAPSSSLYCYDEGVISTSAASKTVGALMMPSGGIFLYSGVEGASPAFSWNAVDWANAATRRAKDTAVASSYSLIRPVAHAVRLTCNGAAASVTGFVHIALVSVDTEAASLNASATIPKTLSNMASLPQYRRVTLSSLCENPLIVVNRFLDETAHRYVNVGAGVTGNDVPAAGSKEAQFNVANSWMSILIVLESSSVGSNSVNFEDICHFEGQSLCSGLSRDFDAEPPNRPLLERVSHAVGMTEAVFYENSSEYANRVKQSLELMGVRGVGGQSSSLNKGGSGYAKPYIGGTAM